MNTENLEMIPDEEDIVVDEAKPLDEEQGEEQEIEASGEDGEGQEDAPEIEMTMFVGDDGVEYEVPASLAPSLMKNKDYTSKTQQLAEQRKEIEARAAELEERAKRDEEDYKLEGELFSVEQQLKNYENVNWDQLEETNGPDDAQRHFRKMQLLQQRKSELSNAKQERLTAKSQSAQQSVAKRYEETEQWAVQNIPNFGPELIADMKAYSDSLGYDSAELQSNMSPKFMKMLYDGYTGNKIKQKAATPKAQAKPNITPLRQVKAKSGTTTRKDPDNMTMAEYRAWRKKTG